MCKSPGPRSCEHSRRPRPPRQVSAGPLGQIRPGLAAPARPPPCSLLAAFMWIKAGKMTSLLTDRYTETSLVIYWLSAPDENH